MVEKILDEASYSLIRTNPKLSTNVKLVVDSSDNIYLESFSANTTLSSSAFKAFKISPTSSYERDVHRFFQGGNVPKNIAYEAFQQFEDTAVLSQYSDQYEMFYDAGAISIASESYTEDLGFLAPLWLNDQIPNYFVIFRLEEPVAVNNVNATDSLNGEDVAQTSIEFTKKVLENCTAIKTFDLTEKSNIGSYIRNYKSNIDFPDAPLTVSWRKDEPFQWSGISYDKGGFVTKGEYAYEGLVSKDGTIIQDEYFITQGFQRTGVIVANLLNMQFLFTDDNAPDYSYNRYFGLYVNSIDEGDFDLSGMGFYMGTEKTQTPKITSIEEVSETLNTSFEIENPQGILLYIDKDTVSTLTGLPTPKRVEEVESIFYVKDKEDSFHTVKKGSTWGKDQIRLFDKKIDISLLTGFKQPTAFATSYIDEDKGQAMASFQFLNNPVVGYRIRFYDGNKFIDEIAANVTLTNGPGTSYEQFFNPGGTLQEVAKAMAGAINGGIPEGERYFDASYNDDVTYVRSRYGGSRFNQLRFELDTAYVDKVDITTYPSTKQFANFIGGNDVKNAQLRVEFGDEDRFSTNRFVKTNGGYADILSYTPYLEEPIYDAVGNNIIGYTNIDKYMMIQLSTDQIYLTSTSQAALYVDYKPSFGRFSFFPIKDFDVDFYSDLYSQEGELQYEYDEYNILSPGTASTQEHVGVGSDPDIINFYDDGGFANLMGLLRQADPNIDFDTLINSEYERLEENYLKTQAVSSRITPYINKWCYYQDGKDVRNHPYRLDVSEAFGPSNFAPSRFDIGQVPLGFSHEWYYLCELPEYFTREAIEESWSYFNTAPVDEVEEDTLAGTPYLPGTFQKVTSDGFTEYFIVDKFDFNNEIVIINKQLRWGTFSGGDEQNFAKTFLRGVKIIAKPKADPSVVPNFNARTLNYVRDGSFNDYKFSAILVPNVQDKPNVEIKFIKNDKWKTLTMIIFIAIDWDYVDGNRHSIDRTLLYSLENRYQTSGTEVIPDAFEDNSMQGAISLSLSSNEGTYLRIMGTPNSNSVNTKFLTDIKQGPNGNFNDIEWEILSGPDAGIYTISGIFKIISNTELHCDLNGFSGPGGPMWPPSFNPTPSEQRNAIYTVLQGGYGAFSTRMTTVSFAEVLDRVSNGDPSIIYETINEDGSRVLNSDDTLAQTFIVELRGQDTFLKSIYVGVLPDPNKPTVFNLTDIIGYDLSLQKRPRIVPFSRHSGNYNPMTHELLYFRDPYLDINFNAGGVTGNLTGSTGGGSVIPDETYKIKVLDLTRYANTQFYSDEPAFGQIDNFFYHKVNTEDPSTILELSNESAFKSLYPLINEVGIDYRDFYIFSSNWDPGYFRKSIDKAIIQDIIGTRSMKEKKSFFGSKYLKVPQNVTLETFQPGSITPGIISLKSSRIKQPIFTEGDFIHKEDDVKIELYLFIQKRLIEYFFDPVKEVFVKYVNPLFGVGNLTTIDDDVRAYISLNILSLYKLKTVELFTRALRAEQPTDYTTAELDDSAKFAAGLNITDNFSSKLLNTNPFDTRLIYNKRSGYSEQIGLSVTLEKK